MNTNYYFLFIVWYKLQNITTPLPPSLPDKVSPVQSNGTRQGVKHHRGSAILCNGIIKFGILNSALRPSPILSTETNEAGKNEVKVFWFMKNFKLKNCNKVNGSISNGVTDFFVVFTVGLFLTAFYGLYFSQHYSWVIVYRQSPNFSNLTKTPFSHTLQILKLLSFLGWFINWLEVVNSC